MAATPPATADYDSASRWGLLALLTVINVLNFVDRQLLASFANFIKPELGLSDTQFGLDEIGEAGQQLAVDEVEHVDHGQQGQQPPARCGAAFSRCGLRFQHGQALSHCALAQHG